MTAEMGPRDVELRWSERLAARSTAFWVRVGDRMWDTMSVRFTARTATLSISGESEHSGDAYNRGQLVTIVLVLNAIIPILPMMLLGEMAVLSGPVGATVLLAVMVPVALFAMVNTSGTASLAAKTDVIDHTTEPLPEALSELQAAYVNGDIGEADLERQVGEVMER